MRRFFNDKEVELLAPAGNFDIFKKVIHSGADAVYLGGKIFNMRMHRKILILLIKNYKKL